MNSDSTLCYKRYIHDIVVVVLQTWCCCCYKRYIDDIFLMWSGFFRRAMSESLFRRAMSESLPRETIGTAR